MHQISDIIQRRDLIFVRGWVKFHPALDYLFNLALPGSCLTRSAKIKSHLCTVSTAGEKEANYHGESNFPNSSPSAVNYMKS